MYISTRGKGQNTRVYLLESYREDGKVKKRVVQNFGYLSDLTNDDPDALEKLKAKFDKTNEKQAKRAQEAAAAANFVLNFDVEKNRFLQKSPELIFTNYVLKPLWNELRLSKTFLNLQNYHYKNIDYNINNVIYTLCFLKIFDPSSIRKAYCHKADLLGAPFQGVTLKNLYNTLDLLYNHKDAILNSINNAIDKKFSRKYSMVFYDVTNVYIESSMTDEERNYIRKYCKEDLLNILNRYLEDGLIDESKITKIIDENFINIDELPDEIKKEIRCMLYLRMRGLSKEHRYDLPLISIALVIDENAIPIDFEIFSGNSSEYKTMVKSIEKIRKKYNITNTIVVADRGINSASNMKMLLDHGYGFLVSQKISNLSDKETKKMFDESGYEKRTILKNYNEPATENNVLDEIKFKTIDYVKKDKKGNAVNCKLVFTFSKKRRDRDNKLIDIALKKAKDAINKKIDIPTSKQSWISFIEKESSKKQKAKKIDKNTVDKKRKLAGYAGIIYHNPPDQSSTYTITPNNIINSYHYLVQIEDCFRIMKNNLGLRPMYVQIEEHIHGHVMCCVLGLILVRLLQIKLDKYGHKMTIEEIIEAIKDSKLVAIFNKDSNIFLSTFNYKSIYRNREGLSEKTLREFITTEGYTQDINIIMKCLGLEPLPAICDRSCLTKCLNVRIGPNETIIDPIVFDLATGRLKQREELTEEEEHVST